MARFEEIPPMARLKGKELALEGVKMGKAAVGTVKAATAIGKVQMEKKGKMRKSRNRAGKTAAAIGKVQMEKKGKSPVETGKAVAEIEDMIQTEKMLKEAREAVDDYDEADWCVQSDPPAAKHRIPDEYVRLILAMKREEPTNPEEYLYLFPGCTVEEARQKHEEEAALFKRINDDFEPFQAMVRKEWYAKGYVEVDYDYIAGLAKVKDVHKEDWDEWRKHQESLEYIEYADSDDEMYAEWYAPYNPQELLEQFNLGEASQKMIALESN